MYFGGTAYYLMSITLLIILFHRKIMAAPLIRKGMILLTIAYVSVALNKLFLPIYYQPSFIDFMRVDPNFHLSQTINLVPLIKMNSADIRNFILNIALFVPLGFLSYYFNKSWKKTLLLIVLTTVFIEIIQFMGNYYYQFMWRIADINDLIANCLGGLLGLAISMVFFKKQKKKS